MAYAKYLAFGMDSASNVCIVVNILLDHFCRFGPKMVDRRACGCHHAMGRIAYFSQPYIHNIFQE